MHPHPLIDRRAFVADLGRGAIALAVIGVAGCGPGGAGSPGATGAPAAGSTPGSRYGSSAGSPGAPGAGSPRATGAGRSWARVNLGFVSAYVLVHGGEAAIVDTGTAGSEAEIEAALRAIGLDWGAVGHVVLTHHHQDHAGGAGAVLGLAPDAMAYAGAEDLDAITVPRALVPVQDGDRVFDLRVVTAPGHTAGSICVLDEAAGLLVAGDALRTDGGAPALPSSQFTQDMDAALETVAKLGALTFETLLVGHGDPIETGASAMVLQLAGAS